MYDYFKVLEIVFDFYLCPVYTVDYTFSVIVLKVLLLKYKIQSYLSIIQYIKANFLRGNFILLSSLNQDFVEEK